MGEGPLYGDLGISVWRFVVGMRAVGLLRTVCLSWAVLLDRMATGICEAIVVLGNKKRFQ